MMSLNSITCFFLILQRDCWGQCIRYFMENELKWNTSMIKKNKKTKITKLFKSIFLKHTLWRQGQENLSPFRSSRNFSKIWCLYPKCYRVAVSLPHLLLPSFRVLLFFLTLVSRQKRVRKRESWDVNPSGRDKSVQSGFWTSSLCHVTTTEVQCRNKHKSK